MKKYIYIILFICILQPVFSLEASFSSQTWFDWYGTLDQNLALDTDTAHFTVSRNYNDLKIKWSPALQSRITLDFAKPTTPVKLAYAEWKIFQPLVLTIGLQKALFGYSPEWKYPLGPVKALADRVGASPTADFGLGVGGVIIDKVLSYNIQVLNGQGYNGDESGVRDEYAAGAHLTLSPVQDIRIGLSFRLAEANRLAVPGKKFQDNAWSLYLDAVRGPLWVLLEYTGILGGSGTAAILHHAQGTAGFTASDFLSFYLSYINQDKAADPGRQALTLAAQFIPLKGLMFKPFASLVHENVFEAELGIQTEIQFSLQLDSSK